MSCIMKHDELLSNFALGQRRPTQKKVKSDVSKVGAKMKSFLK